MDGILPPAATPSAGLQLQNTGLEAQNFTATQHAKLPIGTVVQALVLGNDKNGNLLLRINGSDLLLSSPIALAKGAQLQIRLDSISGNITAELLSVDGKLPAARPQENNFMLQKGLSDEAPQMRLIRAMPEGSAKIAAQQTYNTQAALRVDTVQLSSNPANIVMKAIILQPAPQIMQMVRSSLVDSGQMKSEIFKSLPSKLETGAEAEVRITGVKTSNNSSAPQKPASGQEQIDTSNRALKGQDWMKQANKPVSELMQSWQPEIRTTSAKNIGLNAMVVDNNPNGEMLVETGIGLMRLNGKTTPYTKGTELILEIFGFKPPAPELETEESRLQHMTKEWTTLKNAVDANRTEADKLAGTEHNFGAKLAKFIGAVANNNPESWLGTEFLESLDESAREALITKLKSEFSQLKNLAAEPNSGWQSFLFPVFDGKELNQARLHVKYFGDEESFADSAGTRFIVELETSYYGEMQFDGLIRKSLPRKHFDLIIRTHKDMDEDTKREIGEIFITAQQLSGFIGNLEFATNPQFSIDIWKGVLDKKASHGSYYS